MRRVKQPSLSLCRLLDCHSHLCPSTSTSRRLPAAPSSSSRLPTFSNGAPPFRLQKFFPGSITSHVHSSTSAAPRFNQTICYRRHISTHSSSCQTHDSSSMKQENALVVAGNAACPKQPDEKKECTEKSKSFWTRCGSALRAPFSMSRDDWSKKLAYWKAEAITTLKHYWVGIKLLWTDVRVSSRLLLKIVRGKSLTRRERQQLTRTTADMFRLVPFAIFIVVPFMELLLPVFLKVFPNMLPSTFQDKAKEEEAQQRQSNARIQYARFLQDTVKEMAKEIKATRMGDVKRTAEDLDAFMNRVRTGEKVSNNDIIGFAKLFNDEITLDNLSRPRLISMCKYMGIKPYGTDAYLCYMLRSKLAGIKNDDRLIQTEGIELLSEAELQAACRDRGILNVFTVKEMRQHLKNWLDLSLNYSVPSSLLILSRAFNVSGKMKPEEAMQATLSSLPDEVVESVGTSELPSEEGVLGERMRKLELIKMQEEMIKRAEDRDRQK
ncbi:hypothetical protein GOP47_0023525 [Adiantum capillus-veneris]|uniref:Letm1 RBD domain-containing protein n=1 Tax=Adiantum capillus-veneris TaxID=13818 RepID=A0A9D4U4N8_ADICA|nr:hypothetical protein GOP47_0023525 [Adiantum capillus-veneris]